MPLLAIAISLVLIGLSNLIAVFMSPELFETEGDLLMSAVDASIIVAKGISRTVVRTARRMGYFLAFAVIAYVFTYVALAWAANNHRTTMVATFAFILALESACIFYPANYISRRLLKHKVGPSFLSILVITPVTIGLMALYFPHSLYTWFPLVLVGLHFVGLTTNVLGNLFGSEVVLAPRVLTLVALLTFGCFLLNLAFPQQVRAAEARWDLDNSNLGRESLAKELAQRPILEVTAEKAYLWKVTGDESGEFHVARVMDASGKNQAFVPKGTKFKTIDPPANSVDLGQSFIKVYFQDPTTEEWVFGPDNTQQPMWISAGKTNAPGLVSTVSSSSNASITCTGKVVSTKKLTIPANVMWLDTGVDTAGKCVKIERESGEWSNTDGVGNIWTDGNGSGSWPGLIVPSAQIRALVGKVGSGQGFSIGNLHEGPLPSGRLYAGMNDKEGTYDDNKGNQVVIVSVYE